MALDGIYLKKVSDELSYLIGSHLDKIYQPSHDELIFLLRGTFGASRLILSARSGCVRVGITETKPENPQNPPMFCMLLRKYLNSAKLTEIKTKGLERVITFIFSSLNEMGDAVKIQVVCEMISASPNIILVEDNGLIIDSIRRTDIEHSQRIIQPGAVYMPVFSREKINILDCDIEQTVNKISSQDAKLSEMLISTFEGFSPLIAREIAFKVTKNTEALISRCNKEKLTLVLNELKEEILNGKGFCVLFKGNEPYDFAFTDISQYGSLFTKKFFESASKTLDVFFAQKENSARLKREAQDITRLLSNLLSRTEKKLALRLEEIKKCENREQLRIFGELIKANLGLLKNGDSVLKTVNYYDENLTEISIPLNPALSPAKNAARYFKEYKKTYTAAETLKELTNKDISDIEYIKTVIFEAEKAKSIGELSEIREELVTAGYIKNREHKKQKSQKRELLSVISPDGFKILIGRNNRENDLITTKISAKNDLWLHTKNTPGSHTVIVSEGRKIPESTVLFAATVAAAHSKASASENVPVDYTYIKYVKKPASAKPGMVVYTNYQTIFVTPENCKFALE